MEFRSLDKHALRRKLKPNLTHYYAVFSVLFNIIGTFYFQVGRQILIHKLGAGGGEGKYANFFLPMKSFCY
jgi:hypothetical protein